eukprot:TRINITY_DN31635_c0_g4_i1.p1 TRINITY_DN31635_c0_g4~~TRINITY_DN31635_c0_g4_i1.p1  ORF type:complete len:614 (+),score=91.36 TRINITY_DN31635_c0_g4_i1:247-2088(+)
MRVYESGRWGCQTIWGLQASVFPRAFVVAALNTMLTVVLSFLLDPAVFGLGQYMSDEDAAKAAFSIWGAFSSVLFFVLYFRSNVAYSRWWEGGTLLQQVRGEWFNAYSSIIAFSSGDSSKKRQVEEFQHGLARVMSLLFCSALQQVSPYANRSFEIIDNDGLDLNALQFLDATDDKVEVLLQWVQRSIVLAANQGILPIPPPILSRAFQELSRGIVNLQNARKIAEFPFPYPYAQTSIAMLLIHFVMCPLMSVIVLDRFLAYLTVFTVVFFLWCVNFVALELEQPFGDDDNDLPMHDMVADWNKSLATLLAVKAQSPPNFKFDAEQHRTLWVYMSGDGRATRQQMRLKSIPGGRLGRTTQRMSNFAGPRDDESCQSPTSPMSPFGKVIERMRRSSSGGVESASSKPVDSPRRCSSPERLVSPRETPRGKPAAPTVADEAPEARAAQAPATANGLPNSACLNILPAEPKLTADAPLQDNGVSTNGHAHGPLIQEASLATPSSPSRLREGEGREGRAAALPCGLIGDGCGARAGDGCDAIQDATRQTSDGRQSAIAHVFPSGIGSMDGRASKGLEASATRIPRTDTPLHRDSPVHRADIPEGAVVIEQAADMVGV